MKNLFEDSGIPARYKKKECSRPSNATLDFD